MIRRQRRPKSSIRPRLHPEGLESRVLLAADPIKINFQRDATIDAERYPELIGYLADDGDAFGNRGNGFRYGWLDGGLRNDNQRETRNRNNNGAPDERYDTLNHMIKGDDHSWQIELSNGTYQIYLVAGDPSHTDQVNDIHLISGNNDAFLNDPDGEDNWDEYTVAEFSVTDGVLRLSPDSSGSNQKLAFIEITPLAAPELPVVSTVLADQVESFRAVVAGHIVDDGNETPHVAVHYGTFDGGTNAAAWQHRSDLGIQDGEFDVELTELTADTKYFVRFEATNSAGSAWSVDAAEFHTSPLSVATITNTAATEITASGARLAGRVTSIGSEIPDVVLYWGTADGGLSASSWQNHVAMGKQVFEFSSKLSGLPSATTFYYRFAAINAAGTAWADSTSSFSTLTISPPTVDVSEAVSIDAFSAELSGQVTDDGNEEPRVTIHWGTIDGGKNLAGWQHSADLGTRRGSFGWTVADLAFDTEYFYRVRAENSAGSSWSDGAATFTTLNVTPATIVNDAATRIGSTTARIGGQVTDTGNHAPSVRLYYGSSDGGTDANSWDASVEFAEEYGSFATNLVGLQPDSSYYYRARATNAAGSTWAPLSGSFTTKQIPSLLITELMASNRETLTTRIRETPGGGFGDVMTPDWIELQNPTDQTVVLEGLHLTDDPGDRTKWAFPAGASLGPKQFMVVFASSESISDSRLDERGNYHTNFQLSASGEYLAVTAADGTVIHEYRPGYPKQRADISYGVDAAETTHHYATPSPGSANVPGDINQVADTSFSHDRGFYVEPFTLSITTETAGATIVYTQDGSRPTLSNGTRVEASGSDDLPVAELIVSGTTTVRAAAFKPGYDSTNIDTQTYLFLDNVLQQSGTYGIDGSGLPNSSQWGHSGADWEVDPEIVNHSDPDNRLSTDDLKSIPTLSLVLPWEDMFRSGSGIYISGSGSPRAVSVEQILPDGSTGFQVDASVQIQGGSSTGRWKADKLSMRLKFTEEFGPTKLENPIFGPDAADRFDTVVLDAVLNFGFHHPSTGQTGNAKFIQDQFVANLQNKMGGTAPHARYHHLYINGVYWGMYYVHERPDASFASEYLGGDKDDYDVLKHKSSTAVDGTTRNYRDMLSLARRDLSDPANYQALAEELDMVQFVDYMLLNFYVGNTDWAHHNWYASYNRDSNESRWRFHSWDAEHVLKSSSEDVTERNDGGGPTEIHQRLRANSEYRQLFADRVQKHMFHDGALTPDNAAMEYQLLMSKIDRAIVGETARWGDNRVRSPYTRDDWLETQNNLLERYFPVRTDRVLRQLRSDDLYPSASVPTPTFLVDGQPLHGGYGVGNRDLTLSAAGGTIYFTLDGSDPRVAGGAISGSAIEYRTAISIDQPIRINARLRTNSGEWSAMDSARFYPHAMADDQSLAITEVNYNPHESLSQFGETNIDSDEYEFIEVVNIGDAAIELAGASLRQQKVGDHLEGVSFTFPQATLAPGERAVIVKNLDVFVTRYGTEVPNLLGEFSGQLDDGGERLTLLDASGQLIQQFEYGDGGNWPGRADGVGSSLEIVDARGNHGAASNWRNSVEFGGSPGASGVGTHAGVVINEVLTHTDLPLIDRLELHNTTSAPIDVSNWYVSDSRDDLFSYRIPAGSVIAAGGYLVLNEDELGFGFKGQTADDAWLVSAADDERPLQFVDRVRFGAAQNGVSLGRWPNGGGDLFPMTARSFGAPNSGPVTPDVAFDEIHYHPAPPSADAGILQEQLEFVELRNGSGQALDLGHWRIERGIRFTFAPGTVLPANESIVVVPFDPSAQPQLAERFRAVHRAPADVRLVGPYRGVLDNGGETLELQRPEDPALIGVGYVLVDRVRYQDQAPWPLEADGAGQSLQRLAHLAYGNFVTSWESGLPTPGATPQAPVSGDLTNDGKIDEHDIDELCRRMQSADPGGDLNGSGSTDTDDLDFLVHNLLGTNYGDANLDGVFDSTDLILAFSSGLYEDDAAGTAGWSSGDWNCDGKFDSSDMVVAFRDGGYRR